MDKEQDYGTFIILFSNLGKKNLTSTIEDTYIEEFCPLDSQEYRVRIRVIVFNATFNNISFIS